ncbi:STAS domain-containing protein [Halorhodospira halochloris]|uniref:STAS domain-containing protein n=1 Tax=Halorhodospira halochloris TaxID=1052 RepID=UPI001EE94546|nr:STAS domain-containing protein [Halorhodospira halochloris]MCG5548126.1 STAS domain-containing protein [Halorhodospira halochloris]
MVCEQLECDTQSGCIKLYGALDLDSVANVWHQGEELVRSGEIGLIDLSAVERTDSAGVALLVEWSRAAREAGVSLAFRDAPQQMRAIIRASGVEDVLRMVARGGEGLEERMD